MTPAELQQRIAKLQTQRATVSEQYAAAVPRPGAERDALALKQHLDALDAELQQLNKDSRDLAAGEGTDERRAQKADARRRLEAIRQAAARRLKHAEAIATAVDLLGAAVVGYVNEHNSLVDEARAVALAAVPPTGFDQVRRVAVAQPPADAAAAPAGVLANGLACRLDAALRPLNAVGGMQYHATFEYVATAGYQTDLAADERAAAEHAFQRLVAHATDHGLIEGATA